jgi:hypothetical protein
MGQDLKKLETRIEAAKRRHGMTSAEGMEARRAWTRFQVGRRIDAQFARAISRATKAARP